MCLIGFLFVIIGYLKLYSCVYRPNRMDQVTKFIEPGRQFAKDSIRLVKRCTKPDRKGKI